MSSYFSARSLDAKLSSHPIEVDCPDPGKILQVRTLDTSTSHKFTYIATVSFTGRYSMLCRMRKLAQVSGMRTIGCAPLL